MKPSFTPEYKNLVKYFLNVAKPTSTPESKYADIIQNLFLFPNQFAYIVDYVNFEIIFARNTEYLMGIPSKQLKTNHVIEIITFCDIKSVFTIIEQSALYIQENQITPLQSYIEINYRYINRKKETRWLNRKTMVLDYDLYGNFARMLSICTDITHYNGKNEVSGFMFDENKYHRLNTNPQLDQIFSAREKDIVQLLSKGFNSKKIADELFISPHTVDTHRRNILRKTACSNTIELIDFARQYKLIEP